MMRRARCACLIGLWVALVLLFTAAPAAAQKTDVVVLVNGDRITGEVKLLSRGRLQVSTDDVGTIQIEWTKVASLTSKYRFEVGTTAGVRHIGSLGPAPDGKVAILGTAGETVVALSVFEIVSIAPIRTSFWQRLDGSINLGSSYTQSSGVGQLSFDGKVQYRRPSFLAYATVSMGLTQKEDAPDSTRSSVQFGYTKFRPNRWVVTPFGLVESNRDLGFDLRSTGALTIGRYVVQTNRNWLLLGAGGAVGAEKPVDNGSSTNVDALGMVNASMFNYDYPKTSLDLAVLVFPSLNDLGRIRINANLAYSRELIKDFNFSVTAYNSYDNRPPTAGASKNDVGFSLALGWTF
jgi:hypothetical protein